MAFAVAYEWAADVVAENAVESWHNDKPWKRAQGGCPFGGDAACERRTIARSERRAEGEAAAPMLSFLRPFLCLPGDSDEAASTRGYLF